MSINEYVGKFIQKHRLLSINVKVLVAVSGGMDSMALLSAFKETDLNIGVATVHYDLRTESIQEAELVQQYCKEHNITFHLHSSSAEERENMKSGNLQQKARDIRYTFFEKIMKKNDYTHLMTAHHRDDQVEGFVLALSRGSGLNGLSGMSESKGSLLRPFLHFSKNQIKAYATKNEVPYLDDNSNFSSDYDRNFIRNEVIKLLESRFDNFSKSVTHSIEHLSDAQLLLTHLIENLKKQYVKSNNEEIRIGPLTEIIKIPGVTSLLHHLMQEFGFTKSQLVDMQLAESSGAYFESHTHEAVISDNYVIIRRLRDDQFENVKIDGPGEYRINQSTFLKISKVKNAKFEKSMAIEYFDMDEISFPLILRKWTDGDRLQPIGMKGKSKKVQDLLTDAKLNRFQKDEVKVLTCENDIMWVLNLRMDERFKIQPTTKHILKMSIIYD